MLTETKLGSTRIFTIVIANYTMTDLPIQLKFGEIIASLGGIYGVAIGAAFFGESMFSEVSNGSKIALTHLHDRLLKTGFMLFDTQFLTEHLASLGAIEITQADYLIKLDKALNKSVKFLDSSYSADVETIAHRSTQTS